MFVDNLCYNFALDKPIGSKGIDKPRIKQFEKLSNSNNGKITFHLEDDNKNKHDFKGENKNLTSQLKKKY